MPMVIPCDFAFRETRNYIHTTDLYDALVGHVGALGLGEAAGEIRLTMRRVMRSALALHLLRPGAAAPRPERAAVDVSVAIAGGETVKGWYVETDRPIARRVSYDERPIHALTQIEDGAISIRGASGATPIEVLTSLAVRLHATAMPPSPPLKWLDTRLDLVRPLTRNDSEHMTIALQKVMGTALTKSEITIPSGLLGHIYFSLGTPE